jgi:hypothetical protein
VIIFFNVALFCGVSNPQCFDRLTFVLQQEDIPLNHISAFRAVASMIMPRIKAILSDFMESRPFLHQVDDLIRGEGPCTPHENNKIINVQCSFNPSPKRRRTMHRQQPKHFSECV